MYGGRQFATADQGWVGWFCKMARDQRAGAIGTFDISGTGKQVRDVLHADDMVSLYFGAARRVDAAAGQAFNIGGGIDNSLSLLEMFDLLAELTGRPLEFKRLPARQSDQRVFVADAAKAGRLLGWSPRVGVRDGVARMLDWVRASEARGAA